MAKITITGVKEIDKLIKRLAEPKTSNKLVTRNMRAGMKLVQAEAKAQAPVDTGAMEAAIKVGAGKSRKAAVIDLIIRRKDLGLTDEEGYYPAAVEYGTSKRDPDPFLRRAYESHGEAARDAMIEGTLRDLEAELRK